MVQRLNTVEGLKEREKEKEVIEDIINNEEYADQTIRDRLHDVKEQQNYP
jgi:hypothetical protein